MSRQPVERERGARVGGRARYLAWLLWLGAGAVLGTAGGGLAQLTQGIEGAAGGAGLLGMGLGGLCGAGAGWIERRHAKGRTPIPGARGRGQRPVHGLLVAIPAGLAAVGFLGLGVASALADEGAAAVIFALLAAGAGGMGLRAGVVHSHHLALEAVERGELSHAVRGLERVVRWPFPSVRRQALLHLGWVRLQAGDLAGAAQSYGRAMSGPLAARGAAGLALVRLLQGEHAEAGQVVAQAMRLPGARQVQAQLDGIRLLWVWRAEGPAEARRVAERMGGAEPDALYLGVWAALQDTPPATDRQLSPARRREVIAALQSAGLLTRVPELAEWARAGPTQNAGADGPQPA